MEEKSKFIVKHWNEIVNKLNYENINWARIKFAELKKI